MSRYGNPGSPFYYLGKYRITQRPKPCVRCRQNAYYYHPDFDYVCASHLLDLVNIGGLEFNWDDYPEMWARTERLLQRKPPSFTTVKNMDAPLNKNAVNPDMLWDGFNEEA